MILSVQLRFGGVVDRLLVNYWGNSDKGASRTVFTGKHHNRLDNAPLGNREGIYVLWLLILAYIYLTGSGGHFPGVVELYTEL